MESHRRYIPGAHVLGGYCAEVIQMVAACMEANMRVEQIAELWPAFPTFTEAVGIAVLKIVRQLGIASWAPILERSSPREVDAPWLAPPPREPSVVATQDHLQMAAAS